MTVTQLELALVSVAVRFAHSLDSAGHACSVCLIEPMGPTVGMHAAMVEGLSTRAGAAASHAQGTREAAHHVPAVPSGTDDSARKNSNECVRDRSSMEQPQVLGFWRKPTARRFQLLIALIAMVRSTISASENSARSSS